MTALLSGRAHINWYDGGAARHSSHRPITGEIIVLGLKAHSVAKSESSHRQSVVSSLSSHILSSSFAFCSPFFVRRWLSILYARSDTVALHLVLCESIVLYLLIDRHLPGVISIGTHCVVLQAAILNLVHLSVNSIPTLQVKMPSVYDFRHVELDKVGRGKRFVSCLF